LPPGRREARADLTHASVTTTERYYCALRPDIFSAADIGRLDVDLSRPKGAVIDLATHGKEQAIVGCGLGAAPVDAEKTAT
jgi:hypothetical protein